MLDSIIPIDITVDAGDPPELDHPIEWWPFFDRLVSYCEMRTRADTAESFATWAENSRLVEVDLFAGEDA